MLLGKSKLEVHETGKMKTLSKEEVDKLYGRARKLKIEDSKVHNLNTVDALKRVSQRVKEED